MAESCIAANVARLRLDRALTQAALARKAGLSRVAVGKIERGAAVPQAGTLDALAQALECSVGELVTPVRRLESIRFRARARVPAREQILAQVARWLDDYSALEDALDAEARFTLQLKADERHDPSAAAQAVRRAVGLDPHQSVQDMCGLLERHGVKVLLLDTRRDSFFGLSVGQANGGPAVVVNTWDRIPVERWIFTAAHELGHLLLHPSEYRRDATELPVETEREADAFAAELLMPGEAFKDAWNQTVGHSLLVRVLKVKRLFRVSYRTVLYRLVQRQLVAPNDVWAAFQHQHRTHFGATMRKADEPVAMQDSEFAWKWGRGGEPERLSRHDFVEDRLSSLVRRALQEERISLGRGAEILGLDREQMRQHVSEWIN